VRRFAVVTLVGIFILAACSSSGADPASVDETSTTSASTIQPPANATYHGDLVAETGVTGWVTFTTSNTGDIVDPFVMLEMTDFDCGDGVRLSSDQGVAPIGVTVPVTDGRFEYTGTPTWRGVFTSDSLATGTVEGNLVRPDCEFGPIAWSAELTGVDEPTDTTLDAANTTSTAADPGPNAVLCAVNERFLERAEQQSTGTEGSEFWESQRYDAELLVGLVPDRLRDDMALNAEAWRQFVVLLAAYDYNSRTFFEAVGTEGYTAIFTPEVLAAGQRVQDFAAATCSQ
jgi:hypothetical protein